MLALWHGCCFCPVAFCIQLEPAGECTEKSKTHCHTAHCLHSSLLPFGFEQSEWEARPSSILNEAAQNWRWSCIQSCSWSRCRHSPVAYPTGVNNHSCFSLFAAKKKQNK